MKVTKFTAIAAAAMVLAACGGGGGGDDSGGGSGTGPTTPSVSAYPMTAAAGNYVDGRARAFDVLNSYRTTCGFNALEQDVRLDAAAQGHAQYQSLNTTVTHTQTNGNPGFTGTTATDRATAAGFSVASYYEIAGAGQTNSAFSGSGILMETANHTDPEVLIKRQLGSVYHHMGAFAEMRYAGFGHYQGANLATPPAISYFDGFAVTLAESTDVAAIDASGVNTVRTFPCAGVTGVLPVFTPETPNPMPARSTGAQQTNPYGHPIYIASPSGTTLTVDTFSVQIGGVPVVATLLTAATDPNSRLASHQAYLIPDVAFPDNTAIDVQVTGSDSVNGAFVKSFTFSTGTQL